MRSITTTLSLSLSLAFVTIPVGCNQSTPTTTAENASQPASATTVAVNEYCPVMGGKVTPEGGTVKWDGMTIGFCCDGCDEKWQALSDEEKSEKLAAAQAKTKGDAGHEGHLNSDHDPS